MAETTENAETKINVTGNTEVIKNENQTHEKTDWLMEKWIFYADNQDNEY